MAFKKPVTVNTALKQIVDPDLVTKLEREDSSLLLELVAKENSYDSGSLLMAVAELLDSAGLVGNFLPDSGLIKNLGLVEAELESQNALIFRQADLSVLLVSDLNPYFRQLAKEKN